MLPLSFPFTHFSLITAVKGSKTESSKINKINNEGRDTQNNT